MKGPWRFDGGRRAGEGGREPRRSQGDAAAVVLELAGQHAAVQLVEVHQLDQVGEARAAVVQAVQQAVLVVHLQGGRTAAHVSSPPGRSDERGSGLKVGVAGVCTHGDDREVFDFLRVAQRQHERLGVRLAVPQQEHAGRRRTWSRSTLFSHPLLSSALYCYSAVILGVLHKCRLSILAF